MTSTVLLCTDGSDHALHALASGRALLAPGLVPVIVTVMIEPDPTLVTGAGIAGGVLSPEAFEEADQAAANDARAVVAATREALGLADADAHVLRGEPADAICRYAEEVDASAIVLGSRGRGGIKRALLGSVSDHVVRNAPCPVIITGNHAIEVDEAAEAGEA
jgi:nucleotide-binding universal stress UspA family protein